MRPFKLLALIAVLIPGHLAAQVRVPTTITREWVVEQFLSRIDNGEPAEEERRDSLWIRVRNRPEVVDILLQLSDDPSAPRLVRANAILRLGATSQLRALEHLSRLLSALPPEDPYRLNAILGLGSGYLPRPNFVYERLGEVLRRGSLSERIAAAHALGFVGSARAHQILRNRLPEESEPAVALAIREVLEAAPE